MSICIVDTSVLCELLRVPGKHSREKPGEFIDEMERRIEAGETLLLPMTAILEAGNHIGQVGNGRERREAAERFVNQVRKALDGKSPFTPTPFFERDALARWLGEFPNWVQQSDIKGKRSGFGDLSIVEEWHRQRSLHPTRRVYIWTQDLRLKAYDSKP